MSTYFDRVSEAATWIRRHVGDGPAIGVVLGSGLGAFTDSLHQSVTLPYESIPHWPPVRVAGHAGKLVAGMSSGRRVIALSGRAHGYEGHAPELMAFGVRVLWRMGVRTLILTNAAGGVNPRFRSGALMVIDDHLNFSGSNPLTGPNDERFGKRFADMTEVYSSRLRAIADAAAAAIDLTVEHGVYVAVSGPSYETPAEIRAFRGLGADAVGMSTVHEAIAARHLGMEVLGVSCISNMAAGMLAQPITEEEVLDTASRVRAEFIALVEGIISRL
jgi:purine-nucleoside phosphorylase